MTGCPDLRGRCPPGCSGTTVFSHRGPDRRDAPRPGRVWEDVLLLGGMFGCDLLRFRLSEVLRPAGVLWFDEPGVVLASRTLEPLPLGLMSAVPAVRWSTVSLSVAAGRLLAHLDLSEVHPALRQATLDGGLLSGFRPSGPVPVEVAEIEPAEIEPAEIEPAEIEPAEAVGLLPCPSALSADLAHLLPSGVACRLVRRTVSCDGAFSLSEGPVDLDLWRA